ncbi:MAG: NAD(P)(+) transhydrogenase (Re/Si-specific) subunit beta [Bdellovibrionia bacterium]
MNPDFFAAAYLVATILFIYGLKGLSSPKTALKGNASAMLGMGIAVGVTLLEPEMKNYVWVLAGLAAGAVVGVGLALKISMTAMPQLVAALHSFVGLSAVLVAFGTYFSHGVGAETSSVVLIELAVGSFIGAITFTGSLVAFGKLQELLKSNPLIFKGQHALNLALALLMVAFSIHFTMTESLVSFGLLTAIALALGFLLVLPIGGADMPVVVSMLNSYSGWAASATGFILANPLLITTGALVGSSGAILSYIMCKAMNRSIWSVIFGGAGAEASAGGAGASATGKSVKSASTEDVAFMLENASKVIIIPGYGMAVAQAQHAIKELYQMLTEKGVEVKFAIHPVAGRMPGHMNVLLAESDIPYDCVFEMDEINSDFSSTDVALVVGANDVVNPAAKSDRSSPLYGMPILDVYKAKQIYVSKRSMKAGYAGVDNDLFYYPNCSLVFGDAKATCEALVAAMKEA